MSYRDFVNDKKKGLLKSVLFLYGAEDYLINWSIDSLINEYVEEEYRSLDVSILEGDHANAYDIMSEARSYSMFSDKRVVVVRNYLPLYRKTADAGMEDLLAFAAEPQDSSVLIFALESRLSGDITAFGKSMTKACSSYEFARLEKADLKAFITKRIHAAGCMIGRRELDYLIDVTGYYNKGSNYDLIRLDSDISKITKACGSDDISPDLIEDILTGDSDRFVFNLIDALMAGDRKRSLSIAEAIIREEDGAMAVLSLLTKQFEIMFDAIELSDRGYGISSMAKMTGVNEFRFKKAYKAAGRYSISRLRSILEDLYNTDRDIKNGNIEKDTALELIAVTACPS